LRYKKNLLSIISLPILVLSFWSCSYFKKPVDQPKDQPQTPPIIEQAVPQETEEKDFVFLPEEENAQFSSDNSLQEDPLPKIEANPSETLDEAFENYRDAQEAWENGDLDAALIALDEAYSLLLKVDIPQDSPLVQDRNDLRLLIAQRIQEIYASRRTAISENNTSIPLEENKYILDEIKSFQTKERKYFEEAYKRSGLYRELILKELEKAGLPKELSWMPMIESWFKVKAYSRAKALGLWQFISSTGYRYGLKRNQYIDERMDPIKATQAAVKYLRELHSLFGDWTTALAAYNCGEFRVQRVINAQRLNYLDNFWDLFIMLPRETARFVPRFIATLLIINNPEKYGLNLPTPESPLEFETVKISRPVQLSDLSKALGLKAEDLDALNSELRYKNTPDQEYLLKVPVGYGEKVLSSINSISRKIPAEATIVNHYVRRGETVSGIADRYRTTVTAIARLNRLRRNYLIRPGQRLKVPARGGRTYSSPRSLTLKQEGQRLVYVVKRGDSLYLIAKAFNTTVQRIKNLNNLKSNILRVGQKLTIQSEKPEGAILYTVKRGDIPYNIARQYGMNLNTLLRLNGLSTRSKIYPGQKLWVTPKK